MTQIIKATEHKLIKVFSDDYLFEIPLYQRPYAWTTDQVDELIDDLRDAQRRDPEAPYFLGSIVLIKDAQKPDSVVVDGQQRLTTLAMILCSFRELADDDKREHIDAFVRQRGNDLKGTQDQFRLNLRERDRNFFDHNVQARGAISGLLDRDVASLPDVQQRIVTNVSRIYQQLGQLNEEERWSLATFMMQQCSIVVVTATDRESAYRIFSVMNDRGLDLSPTDILKAETIGSLPRTDEAAYGKRWEALEERLGREDFRDLFTHIRMIHARTKMRQTLQAEFREHVLHNTTGTKFINDTLEPYARSYEIIRDASYESSQKAEQVNEYLRYLGRLDNFDWIPPAITYFHKNSDKPTNIARFVRDLERLAYCLFVLRINVNDRIRRYAKILKKIDDGDVFSAESPLQVQPTEKMSIREKLASEIYLEPPVVRRVLLLRLDSLLAEADATYKHPIVTVEHVLPQTPSSDSQWMTAFTEQQRSNWTHKLANLVLLSRRKNSRASNWDFDRKKNEYFFRDGVSMFALTTQVIGEPEWTPAILERRQKALLEALVDEWRLI